ncbi:MAG: stage II sporulation protein E [Clostridiales bacterium]|mgnify:FL=1|uniref:stage II sporulation protein E n=1 Tax=Terrisporobacter sp. TaxID=1965305 RepID=UPI002A38518B|nr:stage II sporulation protein E [Terrisporobacter sp.]MCI6458965.1 stage II sporulation protein E [Clostridium sp.]MDD5880162.1 stage II sporulation protein E [Clostridiales bacterium]MCI7208055.1 stage II sporulation protein E [Clostridium sp.]MDD7757275.1 stage II sporulation protein E [Clostridiales bacterium]MDY4137193.1 stage II sporulation protein E [Terrisporobacter sp.]
MERDGTAVKNKTMNLNKIKLNRYINIKTVIFMLLGFFLSRFTIVDGVAPFGIAFFLFFIKFDQYKYPVFLSTLAGVLLSFNDISSVIKYSICLVIILIFSNKIKKLDSISKISLLGAIILLPMSLGEVAYYSNNNVYDYIVVFMEFVVTFISSYIFSFGIKFLLNNKSKMYISPEEVVSLSLLVAFSIIGMGDIGLFGVSVRGVLATVLILTASILGGSTLGATSGVIVGLGFMISNVVSALYMGVYSFAGLVSGAFNKLNKYISIIGYLLSWIIIYSYTSGITSNLSQIIDIAIGCLIVSLIPKSFFSKMEKLVKTKVDSNEAVYEYITRSKNITSSKLMNIQRVYNELANTFDKVRERDKIIDQRDVATIIDMIHNDECKYCSMQRICWESKFNYTYNLIYEMIEKIEDGEISERDIPDKFRKECMKPEIIIKVANYYYKMYALDYDWNMKLCETRNVISKQIRDISKSIESISKSLDQDIMLNLDKEKEIFDELQRNNIIVDKVNYIQENNEDFKITIEMKNCRDGCLCDEKLLKIISDFVGESLDIQKIGCHCLGENCKVILTKAEKFKVVTEVATMSRDGHIFCGDNYTFMEIYEGKYMMAISDGMGKGKKAYDESSVTIDILENMMEAKIDKEIVINTINNMLLLKSSEEIFSTLDLGIIDLKKGRLETVKMGACSTYISRENKDVDLISSSSLPVGILSEVNLDRHNVKIKDGDFIIMVSDGIVDAGKNNDFGENWLIYFLKKLTTANPKEIANQILDRALELQLGDVEDDMTVLVTKVTSN